MNAAAAGHDMVDLAFALRGDAIAADYAWALWLGVRERLAWLDGEAIAGIHPLAGVSGAGDRLYLGRRARLTLRLPQARVGDAQALAGAVFDLGGRVQVEGEGSARPLQASAVLYAPFVWVDRDDEAEFVAECRRLLPACGGDMICGKARSAARGEGTLRGYSVMLHGLTAAESIDLQCAGLGGERRLGCGLFMPHKSVAAVGA